MTRFDWNGICKSAIRDLIKPTRRVLNSLHMPSGTAYCVLKYVREGLLDRKGTHTLVESDRHIFAQMCRSLGHLRFNFDMRQTMLHKVKVGPLDYMHLDFLGGLTPATAEWISHLSFIPNAELNFTFGYEHRRRAGLFFHRLTEIVGGDDYHKVFEFDAIDNKRYDHIVPVYMCVLRCLLRRYDCVAERRPINYRDTRSMVVYRFRVLRPLDVPVYPDIVPDILGHVTRHTSEDSEMSTTTTAASLVEKFGEAKGNSRALAGWKRSCTVYCQNKSKETGTPAIRYLAAIKMRLTKQRQDLSQLEGYNV